MIFFLEYDSQSVTVSNSRGHSLDIEDAALQTMSLKEFIASVDRVLGGDQSVAPVIEMPIAKL